MLSVVVALALTFGVQARAGTTQAREIVVSKKNPAEFARMVRRRLPVNSPGVPSALVVPAAVLAKLPEDKETAFEMEGTNYAEMVFDEGTRVALGTHKLSRPFPIVERGTKASAIAKALSVSFRADPNRPRGQSLLDSARAAGCNFALYVQVDAARVRTVPFKMADSSMTTTPEWEVDARVWLVDAKNGKVYLDGSELLRGKSTNYSGYDWGTLAHYMSILNAVDAKVTAALSQLRKDNHFRESN
jgi:hypothetical protein